VNGFEREVIKEALRWWRMRRPIAWDRRHHLAAPRVNIAAPYDTKLGEAVAALLKNTAWREPRVKNRTTDKP